MSSGVGKHFLSELSEREKFLRNRLSKAFPKLRSDRRSDYKLDHNRTFGGATAGMAGGRPRLINFPKRKPKFTKRHFLRLLYSRPKGPRVRWPCAGGKLFAYTSHEATGRTPRAPNVPFVCLPAWQGGGMASTKGALSWQAQRGPKGRPPGVRGVRKRKCDTHTDRQTLNSGLVGNIVQVRQPPLRGCTWGS